MLAAPRLSQPSPVASLLVRVAPMATRAISHGLRVATSIPQVRHARTPPTPSFSRSPGPPLRRSAPARSFSARPQSSPAEPVGRGGAEGRARAGGCAGLPVVHHALFSAPQLAPGHRFPMGVFEAIHAMLLREGRLRRPACTLTPPSLLLPHPCCFPFLHPLSSLSLALHHPLALQVVTPHPMPPVSDLLRVGALSAVPGAGLLPCAALASPGRPPSLDELSPRWTGAGGSGVRGWAAQEVPRAVKRVQQVATIDLNVHQVMLPRIPLLLAPFHSPLLLAPFHSPLLLALFHSPILHASPL
ncbi:unnamed protein product [Closterium sp. Naga37s-1]|nr:unnamed protein product [Closterium sp. Naga37s-1]